LSGDIPSLPQLNEFTSRVDPRVQAFLDEQLITDPAQARAAREADLRERLAGDEKRKKREAGREGIEALLERNRDPSRQRMDALINFGLGAAGGSNIASALTGGGMGVQQGRATREAEEERLMGEIRRALESEQAFELDLERGIFGTGIAAEDAARKARGEAASSIINIDESELDRAARIRESELDRAARREELETKEAGAMERLAFQLAAEASDQGVSLASEMQVRSFVANELSTGTQVQTAYREQYERDINTSLSDKQFNKHLRSSEGMAQYAQFKRQFTEAMVQSLLRREGMGGTGGTGANPADIEALLTQYADE
jgi:hypothetical protein